MLRSYLFLAGLGFAALTLAACGGNTSENTGGAGGSGTGGTGGTVSEGPGKLPPESDPGAPAAMSGEKPVFAIHDLFIGDTDRKGNPSSTAWKAFGYDLDGKISTSDSKDLCMPADGAKPSAVYEDGDDGIDNSFGKNILPIVTALAMDASTQINMSIQTGGFTIMLRLDELGKVEAENGVHSKLYGGSKLVDAMGMDLVPKWDGTDSWPVVYELLNNGDIENPKVQFDKSYVVTDKDTGARTWVSGSFGDLTLNLSIAGFTLGLTVSHAVITMELNADNTAASNGTIAGILETEQLISELAKVAGSFDPSLCPPSSTFESIAQQIRQASDIGADGLQDPTKECNGISIGLGFEMQQVQLGAVADPAMPGADPCMMP